MCQCAYGILHAMHVYASFGPLCLFRLATRHALFVPASQNKVEIFPADAEISTLFLWVFLPPAAAIPERRSTRAGRLRRPARVLLLSGGGRRGGSRSENMVMKLNCYFCPNCL